MRFGMIFGGIPEKSLRFPEKSPRVKNEKQGWCTQRSRYAKRNSANLPIHPDTMHGRNFDVLACVVDGADRLQGNFCQCL